MRFGSCSQPMYHWLGIGESRWQGSRRGRAMTARPIQYWPHPAVFCSYFLWPQRLRGMIYAVASTRLPCWLTRLHHFDGALEERAQLAGVPDRPSAQRSSNPSIWPAMRNRRPVLDADAIVSRAALYAERRPVGAAQSGLGSPAAFLDELDACF